MIRISYCLIIDRNVASTGELEKTPLQEEAGCPGKESALPPKR
jgi:hypothetical protein